jgi:CelD/BcsL family acetyltransferase involved in cellulose biosynthesis
MAVEYHDDLNEVQGDPALALLLDAPAARAPFDRLAWWRALAEECGIRPLLAVARMGEHLAVLPLRREEDGGLAELGNWYSFRIRPILSPGADAAALLGCVLRDLRARFARVSLDKLPEDDARSLAEASRAAGWFATLAPSDVNHVLEVGGRSYAAYLAARPGQIRTTLKRKAKKVEVTLLDRFDEAAWAAYEDIYQASWKPEEGSPAFLRRFAREEGAAGRLRFALARVGGRPVAAQFWTVEAGTAFIHKLAHREDTKPLSPGTTLSAALFEQVIDRDRVSRIDFGTGDDAYKRDWMESVRTRYRLDLLRPGQVRNWPKIARAGLRRLAEVAGRG